MYHIFSCRFAGAQKVAFDSVIDVFSAWIHKSEYRTMVSLSVAEFLKTPCRGYCRYKGDNDDEALLEKIYWIEGKKVYLGLRQTNPSNDENENIIWQSGCIFEQDDMNSAFYVFLNRGVQDSTKSAMIGITPILPNIIAKLHEKKMILDVTGSYHEFSSFPVIYIRQNMDKKIEELIHEIRKRNLHLIAHVIRKANDRIPIGSDFLICFSKFRVCHSYERSSVLDSNGTGDVYMGMKIEHFWLPEDIDKAISAVSWDIFRMVSETQEANQVEWNELRMLCPEKTEMSIISSKKCIINAELLRKKRKELGLSQKELGERAGSSGLTISRLETNQILKANSSLVRNLEQILDLPENSLASSVVGSQRLDGVSSLSENMEANDSAGNSSVKTNFCRRCGTKLYEDSLFCHFCGTKVLV